MLLIKVGAKITRAHSESGWAEVKIQGLWGVQNKYISNHHHGNPHERHLGSTENVDIETNNMYIILGLLKKL